MIKVNRYLRPQNINEALEMLADGENPKKILAGGTDLIIELNHGDRLVDIIDIGGIKELRSIREHEDKVIIGSAATFTQIENSETVLKHCRALAQAASKVGSPQIRNAGTIGGNVANASPAADTVPAIVAMDAEALVASVRGQRNIKITDLLKGIGKTDLAPDEMIVEFSFKKLPGGISGFAKLGKRNALAISRISATAIVVPDQDNVIREARVALGAVAPNPFRSSLTESILIGKNLASGISEDVIDMVAQDVTERLGARASAVYKREAIRGVLYQALEQVFSGE